MDSSLSVLSTDKIISIIIHSDQYDDEFMMEAVANHPKTTTPSLKSLPI